MEPARAAAAHEAGPLLEALGHEVEEADPPWRAEPAAAFIALFAPLVMLQVAFGRMIHGREPDEDEIEPLSLALWERVRSMSASTRISPRPSSRSSPAAWWPGWTRTTSS